MPRKPQPWFRWYVEAVRDPKLRRLTPTGRWLFVAMCSAGRESPELGRLLIAPGVGMTDEEVAAYADVSAREMARALPVMDRLGMVRRDDEGVLCVLNLAHRQYQSDTSTERVRAHRERSKDVPENEDETLQRRFMEQDRNGGRNAPETETETEQMQNPPVLRTDPPIGEVTTIPEKAPAARGTRLPEGWEPPLAVVAEIEQETGLSRAALFDQHKRFADYWRGVSGVKGTKRDWIGTWRNWMRKHADDQKAPARRFGGANTDDPAFWARQEAKMQKLDEMRGLA